MRLKRFYRYKQIDLNGVDAVRTIFNEKVVDGRTYQLEYPSEIIEVSDFDGVKELFARQGQPLGVLVQSKSPGGRFACFDATSLDHISVEYFSNEVKPGPEVAKLEQRLGLQRLERLVRTAFIAHGFDDKGQAYAREISEFLRLIGVEPVTGRHFEPSSVAAKVKKRIENSGAFIAIITPQDDQTWVIQETTYAESNNKYPFLLVEQGTEMKQGLLGDRE